MKFFYDCEKGQFQDENGNYVATIHMTHECSESMRLSLEVAINALNEILEKREGSNWEDFNWIAGTALESMAALTKGVDMIPKDFES